MSLTKSIIWRWKVACGAEGAHSSKGAAGPTALPEPDSQHLGEVLNCMFRFFLERGNARGSVGSVSS